MTAVHRVEGRADELLAGLTAEQREAVTTAASPLCIIAGAGSGKTRVLTRRVGWQSAQRNIDARRVLVLTFSRRAASELRRRLRDLGMRDPVAAGTFHAAALALLRRSWDHNDRAHTRLLTNRLALLAESNPRLDRAAVAALDTEIGWARAQLVTPQRYAEKARQARRRPPRGADFTADAYHRYQSKKQARRLIDFDDVLGLCHKVLNEDTEFAEAQRWRFRHLYVDEFQDVSPLQFAVLQAWLGPESSLTLVGDPDQAIYGWNGANPDLIREIDRHFANIAVLKLHTNFRSTPEVLDAAARVLDAERQLAVRRHGAAPTVTRTDADSEAAVLARAVRAARDAGESWRDQAVLARTNAQLLPLQAALRAQGIPARMRDAGVLRQPVIVDAVKRWGDHEALSAVVADEQLREADRGLDAEQLAVMEMFVTSAADHLALEPDARFGDFMASLRDDDRIDAADHSVELCTFHGSKGLEWPTVHLVGLEDGLVPISHAKSSAARAEERRLLYVAATRAKNRLNVIWCENRKVGTKLVERAPSPWLAAFETKPAEVSTAAPAEVRDLLERLQTPAGRPDCEARAERVAADLRSWRKATADAARITPRAVLCDKALLCLAAEQPTTAAELATMIGPAKSHRFARSLLQIVTPETRGDNAI